MKKTSLVFCLLLFYIGTAHASDLDNAKRMIKDGQLEPAAQSLVGFLKTTPNDLKQTPEALFLLGKFLDRLQDAFSERAEKICYWKGGGDPACMQREAEKLNGFYGAGAFKFVTDIAYIPYTGVHYREILTRFSKSEYADQAEFQLLLKDLVGLPSVVLPKVKSYLERHPKGELNRKALLLWARVNEDIWYIHREWSWVLYNGQISPEELIIRAEPYRQEALQTFDKLTKKYPKTFEGDAAEREGGILKANQNDNETYSILADTVGGRPGKWDKEGIK